MDTIGEYYKRFEQNGIKPEEVFVPASVTVLGSYNTSLPVVGMSLSFGSRCILRARNDSRIILKRTYSDETDILNTAIPLYLQNNGMTKDIINLTRRISPKISGAEILLSSDCALKEFSPEKICLVKALCNLSGFPDAIRSIIKTTNSPAHRLVSLIPATRFAVVNQLTLDYIPYQADLDGYNIICIKFGSKKKVCITEAFMQREKQRINNFGKIAGNNSINDIGRLMYDSGIDYISNIRNDVLTDIFKTIENYTLYFRPFEDLSGITAFVQTNLCDEFIRVIGSVYQKKTGKKPAFYISD